MPLSSLPAASLQMPRKRGRKRSLEIVACKNHSTCLMEGEHARARLSPSLSLRRSLSLWLTPLQMLHFPAAAEP